MISRTSQQDDRVRVPTSSQKLRCTLVRTIDALDVGLETYFMVDVVGPQNDSWWPYGQPKTDIG